MGMSNSRLAKTAPSVNDSGISTAIQVIMYNFNVEYGKNCKIMTCP